MFRAVRRKIPTKGFVHPGRAAARAGSGLIYSAAIALLAIGTAGCLPNNGFTAKTVRSSSKTLKTIGSDTTSSDDAKFPCTNYSEGNPDRAICVDCYSTVLSTNCGPKDLQGNTITEYSQCLDNTIKSSFVNLLNQCIASSIVAGFTCNTICSSGLVLDASSCTCITQTSSSSSGPAGGSQYIDVGQSDFGPPVVSASWPLGSVVGTAQNVASSNATVPSLNNCSATLSSLDPVALYIRNRGDTLPWQDVFSNPVIGPSGTNGANFNMLTGTLSSTTPVPAKPSTVALNNTAQAGATFTYYSGGMFEFFPNTTATTVAWNSSSASSHLFQGYPGYVKNISGNTGVAGITGGYGAGQYGWSKLQVLNEPLDGDGKEPVIAVRESDGDAILCWLQIEIGDTDYRPLCRFYEDSDSTTPAPSITEEDDVGSSTSRNAGQLVIANDHENSEAAVLAWTEEVSTSAVVKMRAASAGSYEIVDGFGGRLDEVTPFAQVSGTEFIQPAIAMANERVLVAATKYKSTSNMGINAKFYYGASSGTTTGFSLGSIEESTSTSAQNPRVDVAKCNGTYGGSSSTDELLGIIGWQEAANSGSPSLSHCHATYFYMTDYDNASLNIISRAMGYLDSGNSTISSATDRIGRNTRVMVSYGDDEGGGSPYYYFEADDIGIMAFCEEETAAASGKFQISYWMASDENLDSYDDEGLTQQPAITSVLEDARDPETDMNRNGKGAVIYRSKPDGETNYRIKLAYFEPGDYEDSYDDSVPGDTVELSDGSRDASNPKVSIIDNGDILASWVEDNNDVMEVWTRKYTASTSTWESPTLQVSQYNTNSFAPMPALDASGEDSVIFQQGATAPHSIVWNRRSTEPTWASQSTWRMPAYMARDRFGNIYTSDPAEKVIRVACYNDVGTLDNYWCSGKTAGFIYTIVGFPDKRGTVEDPHDLTNDDGTWCLDGSTDYDGCPKDETLLGIPMGIAVDRYANVFFADSYNHVIGVVCADGSSGICAEAGRSAETVYVVAGVWQSQNTTDYTGQITTTGKLNHPWGVDIESVNATYDDADDINIYVANGGTPYPLDPDDDIEGFISAECGANGIGTIDGHNTGCTAATAAGHWALLRYVSQPTDIKVNWNGNIFYTAWGKGVIREDDVVYQNGVHALCYDISGHKDLCNTYGTLGADTLLAGLTGTNSSSSTTSSAFGSAGDGGYANLARTTQPSTLAIAKAFGDDVHGSSHLVKSTSDVTIRGAFRDNNIAFVESMWTNLTGASSGNVVRVICGDNTSIGADVGNKGVCLGRGKGTIFRLAGKYGLVPAYDGVSHGRFGPDQSFAGLFGITYDKFKNVMVTTQATASPPGQSTTYIDDHGIRSIMNVTLSKNAGGIKYTITDSNTLSATYCLRFKTRTACYYKDEPQGANGEGADLFETCSCEATPPYGATDMGAFWRALGTNQQCGGP